MPMDRFEVFGWLLLALALEKLLDYAVWPTWKRRKAKRAPKGKTYLIIKPPKPSAQKR